MTAIISTAYSRDLGDELRRIRETCTSFGGRAMAAQLGWDPSKVSNIETGKARASDVDLAQYLATCGKDLDYLQDFGNRYRHAFDLYFAQGPTTLRTLTMAESMATKIFVYEVLAIPGLLQTESFARALFTEVGCHSPEEVEDGVSRRMGRQSIWQRPYRPECLFYVHELALRMRIGDAKVMEDQYLRLLFNAHILRVVPASVKPVTLRSKCTLFEFAKAAPLAYTESDLAKVFVQDDAAIAATRKLFERLDAVALESGSPGEFHPWAPTDPGVTVSRHRALVTLVTRRAGPKLPRSSARTCGGVAA
ncbi:helix-turn-helix domain-containing protein [Lentzea aerocolonigenes]|uniref:helix-turn-helix domain-containing protein n=2 Tax=Lentzea aerocolonigenes TaxID=68170 RepID=UPI0012E260F0|nr:helix-turn-helix transcriptional regulator [Lentzea aerocolonigenes]MCP2249220.1 Helix-turn-helix domain-containing protein [Lentzea aerocolonigenes]